MGYNLEFTRKASQHVDKLVAYLLDPLKNGQAASHFLSGVDEVYARLEEDPWQFPACTDYVLRKKEYRKAKIPGMSYVVIYQVDKDIRTVYVMGIFHELENYGIKL